MPPEQRNVPQNDPRDPVNNMVRKKVNKKGWWGILLHGSWPTMIAVGITAGVFGVLESGEAAASSLTAGSVVWMLSAVSILLIAVIWKNYRHLAIPVAMGAFVAKIVILGLLLTMIPQPEWLHTFGAAIGALVAIVVWQVAEVVVFMHTRRLIYS